MSDPMSSLACPGTARKVVHPAFGHLLPPAEKGQRHQGHSGIRPPDAERNIATQEAGGADLVCTSVKKPRATWSK